MKTVGRGSANRDRSLCTLADAPSTWMEGDFEELSSVFKIFLSRI